MLSNTIKERVNQIDPNDDKEIMSILVDLNNSGIVTKVSQRKGFFTVEHFSNGIKLAGNSFKGSMAEAMHNSLLLLVKVL